MFRVKSRPGLPRVNLADPLARGIRNALVFENGYAWDAAKGLIAPLTAAFGTPRYAASPGSGELSLYTPNGAAASLAIAEDWSGPCTIIWRCYIESVDSPWGGLWVKIGVGTATQLTFQRSSSNNNFYVSRNYSSSLITGRTLSSLLGIPATFALTNESAAATSRLAIHLDGSLVQAFNPVEAQTGGAGTLLLGCENSSSATYDSSVYWREFFRFDRELSAGEISAIGRDPRQLLVQERRIWVPMTAPGGGPTTYYRTLSAEAAASSALSRQALAIRQANASANVAILRAIASAKAATATAAAGKAAQARGTSSASVSTTGTKTTQVRAIPAATVITTGAKTIRSHLIRPATTTISAALAAVKAKLLTLSGSVTTSAAAVRATLGKRSATATAHAGLLRGARLTRAAVTSSLGLASRAVSAIKSAGASATATVATLKARLLTLAATVTTTASVGKLVRMVRGASASISALFSHVGGSTAPAYTAALRFVRTLPMFRRVRVLREPLRKVNSMGTAEQVAGIDVAEEKPIDFIFTDEFAGSGITIASAAFEVDVRSGSDADPSAFLLGSYSINVAGDVVTQWVKGRVPSTGYAVRCVVTGSDGKPYTAVAQIQVKRL